MGFWNTIGSIAKIVGKEVLRQGSEALDRSKQYREEMETKTDEQLFRIIKDELENSPMKAGAAGIELKNRGYEPERINNQIRNQ